MKVLVAIFLFCLSIPHALAQDTTLVLSTRMFAPEQSIHLSSSPGWVYQAGHNPAWAKPDLNTATWQKKSPAALSITDADASGRMEGWFRLSIQLDSSFSGLPVWLRKHTWAAADLYVDGRLLASFGNTGADGNPYQDHNPWNKPPTPVQLTLNRPHLIAVHFVDHVWPFSRNKLKSASNPGLDVFLRLAGPRYNDFMVDYAQLYPVAATLWVAISLMIALFFWLLSAQKLEDKQVFRLLAMQSSFAVLNTLSLLAVGVDLPFAVHTLVINSTDLTASIALALIPIVLLRLVEHPLTRRFSILLLLVAMVEYILFVITGSFNFRFLAMVLLDLAFLYVLITSWRWVKGAQWAIVAGLTLALVFAFIYTYADRTSVGRDTLLANTGYFLAIPFSFLVYVALRFKEILADVRQKAVAVLQVTEEKRSLLTTQNERLEQQVRARTAELNTSLETLKTVQAQLIHKEKMASLGELTAGIAHEIQNPLNFVNNFSEVCTELVTELEEEQQKSDRNAGLEAELLGDLKRNLGKINHHGGRIAAIVRRMMEHSRSSSGEKRPVDLNALAEEYLKIAYKGIRAKDKAFQAQLIINLDPALGEVAVAPQEMGRVLLNLFNNAFYAVVQRNRSLAAEASLVTGLDEPNGLNAYIPTVSLTTKRLANTVELRVSDNGIGIPDRVKAKIFQPFFTTKPTGESMGLGLSLSYDIITKGHGGELSLANVPGQSTEFIITLPVGGLISEGSVSQP